MSIQIKLYTRTKHTEHIVAIDFGVKIINIVLLSLWQRFQSIVDAREVDKGKRKGRCLV